MEVAMGESERNGDQDVKGGKRDIVGLLMTVYRV